MPINFRKTRFVGVAANLDQCPEPDYPEVILSGRSNVGKSSLINILADNRHLARTSQIPGKTRMIIYFNIDDRLLLTDLPGYGFASAPIAAKKAFSGLADRYLESNRPIALILHLLDIRHDPSRLDIQMAEWLNSRNIPSLIILTKGDKLSRSQALKRKSELAAVLGADDKDLLIFSAQSRLGLIELRQRIADFFKDTAAE